MTHVRVFGYGSLVNRATHDYAATRPAVVRGWRRAWRRSPLRPVSFLTVVPDASGAIEGLVAEVPATSWPALDAREGAYERIMLDPARGDGIGGGTAIYALPAGDHEAPAERTPVLMSYLDTVLQGYLAVFGERGVAGFFATTDGWDAPVLDDRAAPRYRRAVAPAAHERALVDAWLGRIGTRVVAAD